MPLKNGHFTPLERRFIDAMVRFGDAPAAAWRAGVSGPMTAGYTMLAKPAIRAEVARQAEERLFTEGLPKALEAHMRLLDDRATPAGARVQAIKLVYDRTLGSGDDEGAEKEPSDMSAGELQRSIARLNAELEGRPLTARDITPAPTSTVIEVTPDKGVFD